MNHWHSSQCKAISFLKDATLCHCRTKSIAPECSRVFPDSSIAVRSSFWQSSPFTANFVNPLPTDYVERRSHMAVFQELSSSSDFGTVYSQVLLHIAPATYQHCALSHCVTLPSEVVCTGSDFKRKFRLAFSCLRAALHSDWQSNELTNPSSRILFHQWHHATLLGHL